MFKPILCLSTCATSQEAESLAQLLVEQRLAACVNLVPGVVSIYRWENKIQKDQEILLLIKTDRDRWLELQNFLTQKHPYQVPELISFDVRDGYAPYLDWLQANTRAI
jgi:periplasmic divalent cation tolerance protein